MRKILSKQMSLSRDPKNVKLTQRQRPRDTGHACEADSRPVTQGVSEDEHMIQEDLDEETR